MKAVLGVGGGIAAYKSAELARALIARGFRVQTIMTAAARQFVQPLTFAALTGNKVITGLFSEGSSDDTLSSAIEHIAVARDNDVLVIAPATAVDLRRAPELRSRQHQGLSQKAALVEVGDQGRKRAIKCGTK